MVGHILANRSFHVHFRSQQSSSDALKFGVPQGSVLGPLLFIIYTAQLDDIVAGHSCKLHTYADDNQVYIHCRYRDVKVAASKIESCVTAINN